jgi:hypothetical protein
MKKPSKIKSKEILKNDAKQINKMNEVKRVDHGS